MKGLYIKKKWLDLIVAGKKRMEIRGTATKNIKQTIALVESGTGLIRAYAYIESCKQIDRETLEQFKQYHCIEDTNIVTYKNIYAGVFGKVNALEQPVKAKGLKHGQVVWINLE